MSGINYSPVSRPFVISAVLLSFIGVTLGTLWMASLLGLQVPQLSPVFQIHKLIQLEGFLTLLIMGVGYMIIPRFRNIPLPSNRLAILSFLLVLSALVLESVQRVSASDDLTIPHSIRLAGVLIFAVLSFYSLRTVPKLLREADYFLAVSISVFVLVHIVPLAGFGQTGSLNYIQLWLLFPVIMIFGVQFKTLPSFLGFMRPRKGLTAACLASSIACCTLGAVSLYIPGQMISAAFSLSAVAMSALFALACYIFGGFDNREILRLMPGEKRARFDMVVRHSRIGFLFLVAGFALGSLFYLDSGFLFYDLAIHYVAIGFLGVTIMLFLPLMLPPITGKAIQFLSFNKLPLVMILLALAVRTVGDYAIEKSIQSPLSLTFAISGLLVLAGMVLFIIMIHRSMTDIQSVNVEFKK